MIFGLNRHTVMKILVYLLRSLGWQPGFLPFRQQNGKRLLWWTWPDPGAGWGDVSRSSSIRWHSQITQYWTPWLTSSHLPPQFTTSNQLLKCSTPKYETRITKHGENLHYERPKQHQSKATWRKQTLTDKVNKLVWIMNASM